MNMMKIYKLIPALTLMLLCLSCEKNLDPVIKPADDTTIEKVLGNIQNYQLSRFDAASAAATAQTYMDLLKSDGTFSDIDYTILTDGHWSAIPHVERMPVMAVAYVKDGSPLKGSEDLYSAIVSALTYWSKQDSAEFPGWYYSHIYSPRNIGPALCVLRLGAKKLPEGLEDALLDQFYLKPRRSGYFTDANKQMQAHVYAHYYVLRPDGTGLAQAAQYFFEEFQYAGGSGESVMDFLGFQVDGMYLLHGPQPQNIMYGNAAIERAKEMNMIFEGTSLYRSDVDTFIAKYMAEGMIPLIRGSHTLFTARCRLGLSQYGYGTGEFVDTDFYAEKAPEYADVLKAFKQRVYGFQDASYGISAKHTHYWRGDMTVHQRPEYTVSFKACSNNRIAKREIDTNWANYLGYFVHDGALEIDIDGGEYANVFGAWEWDHIPGVTSPAGYGVTGIPHPEGSYLFTWGNFTGGVSDGKYGCSVYDLIDKDAAVGTAAHKGYFFFDNEVVMLGSGVNSTNTLPIHTTVNQCNLRGNVVAEDAAGAVSTISEQTFGNLRWLSHDNVCYYFPEDASISVRAGNQTGSWSDCDPGNPGQGDYTIPVMKAYFDHGVTPADGKYVYYVLPARADIAAGKAALDKISYSNEKNVQWVYNQTLDIFQAIFYEACSVTVEGVAVSASEPCVMMVSGFKSGASTLSVADPSCSKSSATVAVGGKSASVSFPTEYVWRGQTVSLSL